MSARYLSLDSPNGRRTRTWRYWTLRLLSIFVIFLTSIAGVLLLIRYLITPLAVFFVPELEVFFYELGAYGLVPEQSYVSFKFTSPRMNLLRWDPGCNEGYVLLGLRGGQVTHPGPLILETDGSLIWSGHEQSNEADNIKIQRYRGQDYLTFWNGERQAESGQGKYFMLDHAYNIAYTVSAVGVGLNGDMHEFKISNDDTALITVYTRIKKDFSSNGVELGEDLLLIDGIFQEIDIESGSLLFEWRASDHLDSPYLNGSYMKWPADGAFDYFHINSVDKDLKGNYLVSLRHVYTIVYISGETGEILWGFGGRANDFGHVVHNGPTYFEWQHDARWLDEERGIISVFNNDITHNYFAAGDTLTRGMIIQLDFEKRNATLLHEYSSADGLLSPSMGSMQVLPSLGGEEPHVFIGWGAAAAYSEFELNGSLLCEAHFAPAWIWPREAAKSYRATKVYSWDAVPADWDPSAVVQADSVYVSWNGATTVDSWLLQGSNPTEGEPKRQYEFKDLNVVAREGFETSIDISNPNDYAVYRVAALDAEGNILRYSNIVESPSSLMQQYALAIILCVAVAVVFAVVAFRHRQFLVELVRHTRSRREHFKYELVDRDGG